jgi:hypothetical protein
MWASIWASTSGGALPPYSGRNLNPDHWLGLWLEVMTTEPPALRLRMA